MYLIHHSQILIHAICILLLSALLAAGGEAERLKSQRVCSAMRVAIHLVSDPILHALERVIGDGLART